MRLRWIAAAAAMSLTAGTIAGCGSDNDSSAGITVGYSTYTLSNPYFAGIVKGLEEESAKQGFDLVTTNSNSNPAQQVTDIQNLISRGVNYVILTPMDGTAIAPAVAAADSAGVPVIVVADRVEPEVATQISRDEVTIGTAAGEYIVEALTTKYGKPAGNVVQIEGVPGIPSTTYRKQGFEKVLAQYPDIKIVASQDGGYATDQTYKVMVNILQSQENVDAVFATNDAEALGVTAALKSENRLFPVGDLNHVTVIGADGSAPAIADIRAGIQDATISSQPITAAQRAVQVVADLVAGKEVEKDITMPMQVISVENIDSDEVKTFGIWADEL